MLRNEDTPIQFSSVAQSCLTLCNPMEYSMPGFLSITNSWSLLKLMSIKLLMPSNISSSITPFFSCLQSFPASGSFPVSQFFTSGGQSIGVSALASVHPVSDYNRLNYGKDTCNRDQHYVTCNCQSKLSVHALLDEHVKALCWKPLTSSFQCFSCWREATSPWGCSFCSFFNKLVFAVGKTSDSSLCPHQEPRPMRKSPLQFCQVTILDNQLQIIHWVLIMGQAHVLHPLQIQQMFIEYLLGARHWGYSCHKNRQYAYLKFMV